VTTVDYSYYHYHATDYIAGSIFHGYMIYLHSDGKTLAESVYSLARDAPRYSHPPFLASGGPGQYSKEEHQQE
jgi:hypothetical protein